eukprot:763014-Hanusia_phi.AAC.1
MLYAPSSPKNNLRATTTEKWLPTIASITSRKLEQTTCHNKTRFRGGEGDEGEEEGDEQGES